MPRPNRPADAEVLGDVAADFWARRPNVEHAEHRLGSDGVNEWSLWLIEPANDEAWTFRRWLGARNPGRAADLRVENEGHAPPPWFWEQHPDVVAFSTDYDDGLGAYWWTDVWTKAG